MILDYGDESIDGIGCASMVRIPIQRYYRRDSNLKVCGKHSTKLLKSHHKPDYKHVDDIT